jgi:hypothetical protein
MRTYAINTTRPLHENYRNGLQWMVKIVDVYEHEGQVGSNCATGLDQWLPMAVKNATENLVRNAVEQGFALPKLTAPVIMGRKIRTIMTIYKDGELVETIEDQVYEPAY